MCHKLKETKENRDEIKEKVEHLTKVLLKLSKPPKSTPSSSTPIRFDFSSVPMIKKINEKGELVDEWIQRLLLQGKEVIDDTMEVYKSLEDINKDGEKMDDEFSSD
ncbi:hypothetical protein KI387_024202, partial [Taxus chinensis]